VSSDSPRVVTISPAAGATGVTASTRVEVLFSRAMREASVSLTPDTSLTQQLDDTQTQLTASPVANLASDTTFTVRVSGKDLSGHDLGGDTVFTFTTAAAAPADTTAPQLLRSSPTASATSVALDAGLSLELSEEMSLDGFDVAFAPPWETGPAVWNDAHTTVRFEGVQPFAAGTTYQVGLTGRDLAGNPLGATSVGFTTVVPSDTEAPTVTAFSPAATSTAVSTSVVPSVTFSEPMQASAAAAFSISPTVPCVMSFDPTGTILRCVHPSQPNLAGNTTYTLAVSTAARDLAGNPLAAPAVATFTTSAAPDITAPTVVDATPAMNSTVKACSDLTLTFSEPMDKTSVQSAFSVTPARVGTFSWQADGGPRVTFNPSSDFDAGVTVTFGVSTAATDLSGNALGPTSFSRSFRTYRLGTAVVGGSAQDGQLSYFNDGGYAASHSTVGEVGDDYVGIGGLTHLRRRTAMHFDLSALPPPPAFIKSARLTMFQIGGSTANAFLTLGNVLLENVPYATLSPAVWTQATSPAPAWCSTCLCLSHAPYPSHVLSSSRPPGWRSVDVTDEVQAGLADRRGGFWLRVEFSAQVLARRRQRRLHRRVRLVRPLVVGARLDHRQGLQRQRPPRLPPFLDGGVLRALRGRAAVF